MDCDVIIVGAGASGLVAAIAAARKGSSVLVIEQKEKAGKKILATGNGKCNFTNRLQRPECYRSDDSAFAMKVLSCFDFQQTISLFEELGIYPKERAGYLYPNSEQAASVVDVLLMECKRLGVSFLYGEKVIRIEKPDFTVVTKVQENRVIRDEKSYASSDKIKNNDLRQKTDSSEVILHKYFSTKLILAAGGCAAPKLGSDGSGYTLAKAFGHTLIKPLPALVQLKSSDKFCKTLSGVRTIVRVASYGQNNHLDEEEGEIIFTDYGISGIPIMQLSRFAAKALDQKKKVHLIIDYLPGIRLEDINNLLKQRIERFPSKTVEEMMVGLFNHKLSYILIKEAKLDPFSLANVITPQQLLFLSKQIKEFRMMITDTNSFENAQVCAGGVVTREVDENTMESKLVRNLYLAGELLDVDGTCGGYNLQWAWSSGYLAGASAGIMKADKIRTGVK